jgi:GntR family transcriptional regulator
VGLAFVSGEDQVSESAANEENKSRMSRQSLPVLELDPAAVDPDSPVPVYLQVEQDIRRQVKAIGLATEARLPRETELAELYSISRMTLRNALARLEDAKVVRREHGIGTIINAQQPTLACNLGLMKRLQTQIRDQGFVPGLQLIQLKTLKPIRAIAEALRMAKDEKAIFVERLISVNGHPTALIRSWMAEAAVPGFADEPLLEDSVWKTIEVRYGRRVAHTSNSVEMVELNTNEAHHLNLAEGERTLCLTGLAVDSAGLPVEYSVALWGQNARIHFDAST